MMTAPQIAVTSPADEKNPAVPASVDQKLCTASSDPSMPSGPLEEAPDQQEHRGRRR